MFVIEVSSATPAAAVPATTNIDETGVISAVRAGPDGVQYGANNCGAAALAVAPDGTLWIVDTVGNRLLQYNLDGRLQAIPIPRPKAQDPAAALTSSCESQSS